MTTGKANKYNLAAEKGDLAGLKDILDGKEDPNIRDAKGCTPLFVASGSGQAEVMQELLKHGEKVNSKNFKRWTPLHNAAAHGQNRAAEILLSGGADINRGNIRSATPLMLSCRQAHLPVTILLVKHKCSLKACDMHGRQALHWAVKGGNLDIVKFLLENGADVNAEDHWGKTPFFQAVKSNRASILHHLLNLEVDVSKTDRNGRQAIHVAAEKNCVSALKCLIAAGVSPDTPLQSGRTPLMDAAFSCQMAAVHALIGEGANVNAVDSNNSMALHHVVFMRVNDRQPKPWFDLAFFLVQANSNVSLETNFGMFALRGEPHHPQNVLEMALKGGLAQFVKLFARSGSQVGNVKMYLEMKTKELTMFVAKNTRLLDWIRRFYKNPRPLKELARTAFRRYMPGVKFVDQLGKLGVAPGLKDFIMFHDLEDLREELTGDTEGKFPEKTPDGLSDSENDYEPSIYDSDEHIDRNVVESD